MWTVHAVYDCKAYLHAHTAGGRLDFIHTWGMHAPALLWEQEIVSVLGQDTGGKQVEESKWSKKLSVQVREFCFVELC